MKIILIGYMGSGKSSVGKLLANTLKYNFIDLDKRIEEADGRTISQIFEKEGEIYFRKIEAQLFRETLNHNENVVLATGGGTPCYANAMEYVSTQEDMLTIYLKASLDTLTDRLFKEKEQRPIISHLSTTALLNDFIRKHLFERSFYYNQAKQVVNTDEKTIDTIVSDIVLRLF